MRTIYELGQQGQRLLVRLAPVLGPEYALQVVGLLDSSIFQGVLVLAEDQLKRIAPETTGHEWFLIETASTADASVTATALETALRVYGFDTESVNERLASFLAGDDERGLALIARAVEDGYFILPSEAYLQDLYEHPGFAAIRAMQEARQARERGRFLAVVCADNPYAAVWQPAEGTCERFAAEGGD